MSLKPLTSRSTSSLPDLLPSLDGIRGIAILLVVTHNLMNALPQPTHGLGRLYVAVLDRGWIGVQLFFVLSGFLITRILLSTQTSSNYFSSFFARRVLRIFPLYYGSLVLLLVVLPWIHAFPTKISQNPAVELSNWFYLTNWFAPYYRGNSLTHLWSLAVEEQFYLVWPLIVWKAPAKRLLPVCAGIVLLSMATRGFLVWAQSPEETIYEFTLCRMDALALGAAAAAAFAVPGWAEIIAGRRHQFFAGSLVVLGLGGIATRGFGISNHWHQVLGYTVLAVALTLALTAAACSDGSVSAAERGPLRWPVLRKWGRYSYGIYIWHVPLSLLVGVPVLERFGLAKSTNLGVSAMYVVLMSCLCYLAGILSYKLFEEHFLNLKKYFKPSGSVRLSIPAKEH